LPPLPVSASSQTSFWFAVPVSPPNSHTVLLAIAGECDCTITLPMRGAGPLGTLTAAVEPLNGWISCCVWARLDVPLVTSRTNTQP
jgi:hypothetical protein